MDRFVASIGARREARLDGRITLSVPAEPGSISVLRAVVAGVAARLDLAVDDIEDLRLAVDEACAHLLSVHPRGGRLGLRVDGSDDRIHVVAWTDVADPAWPRRGAGDSLAWRVLSALTEGPSLDREDGLPAIRFSKRAARRGNAP